MIMKKINIFLLIALGIFLVTLSSCSSSQTFMVQGVPGTVISSPTNQRLAVLDNMGQAQIKTKRKEGYYHYLQAQVPGSNLQVPFALDYKNNSRAAKRGLCKGVGYTVAGAGWLACMVGLIGGAAAGENSDTAPFGYAALGGLGAMGLGWLITLPGNGDAIESDYDYQKDQVTNSDIIR